MLRGPGPPLGRLEFVGALTHPHGHTTRPPRWVAFVFPSLVFWDLEMGGAEALAVAGVWVQSCPPPPPCTSLRRVGFAAAGAHGHPAPPERDAAVRGVRAGPDGRARGQPRALRVRRLPVPDPGERGGGPDRPAEQGLGVGALGRGDSAPGVAPSLRRPPWEMPDEEEVVFSSEGTGGPRKRTRLCTLTLVPAGVL